MTGSKSRSSRRVTSGSSPALTLLGNAQNPAYAHPKLLARCFDNVYFCGRIIGDLPARGRAPHSKERTKLIYDQEYEELVHRLENMLDLTLESPSYSMVPTSLVNPDIVLLHHKFRKRRGLLELPPGRGPEQREYSMDGARGLVDWTGLKYPIPTIPPYLFTPLPESCQSGAQVPVKPSQLAGPGGDVRHPSRESWKWLVTVLQFWMDEATVADGAVYGGRVRPASALAEYVMDTVNPGLEPGSKVSWEDVITRTPWMSKRLHGMTTGQEQTVRRQALPMPGESSELEVLSEKLYTDYSKKLPSSGGGKSPLGRAGTLRLHLKKAEKGWTQASQSSTGPGVGNPNRYPKEVSSQSRQGKLNQPSRSPLTNELLDPGEELLGELDYEDVEEINPQPDLEIAQAVTNIPQADVYADVEMQDIRPPPGFEPEVAKAGYDVNLVRSDQPEQGSSSPVTAREDRLLDVEESQPKAPGNGRPGHNPNQAADN